MTIFLSGVLLTIYFVVGMFAYGMFGWCLGMPSSFSQERSYRIKKACMEWSIVLFWPVWLVWFAISILNYRP